ncbi:hypothetical protein FD754_011696, partial [Muntiacus muntjak]
NVIRKQVHLSVHRKEGWKDIPYINSSSLQVVELQVILIPPKPTVFISGVIARGDKDFPPAAAQVAHQKPHASIDRHPSPRTQHIQQPRK